MFKSVSDPDLVFKKGWIGIRSNWDQNDFERVVPTSMPTGSIPADNIQGESKKTGISGVLADFGNSFFQNVMAFNIIENFKIF